MDALVDWIVEGPGTIVIAIVIGLVIVQRMGLLDKFEDQGDDED